MAAICLLFSLIRPHNSIVYAPKLKYADKKHAPPTIGKGIFAWFGPVIKTKEDVMVEKVGVDAVVFLRFTRMCRNIFAMLAVLGCGILLPVHMALATQSIVPIATDQAGPLVIALQKMTPQYVQGQPMWAHVVVSYLFDIIIVLFLWTN